MDPQNLPFELISYRGLLKSLEDMKKGNFMKIKIKNYSNGQDGSEVDEDYTKNNLLQFKNSNVMTSIKKTFIISVFTFISFIEGILFFLMSSYDNYVYSPLQKILSPIVHIVPRYIRLGEKQRITIFTANIVTLSRTFLVIPIAWFLKYDYNLMAFLCVVFHDFLDHLDGIVAKVHRVTYPNHDDPILGGFLDAFCDKIVNVLSIWTILQTTDLSQSTSFESAVFLAILYAVIAYESIIGIVRVQDFFIVKFKRDFKINDSNQNKSDNSDPAKAIAASMEGKLKEKLESMGIAFLCMSIDKTYTNPISNAWGISGLVCLLLTLRMAHKSLSIKLRARENNNTASSNTKLNNLNQMSRSNSSSADNLLHFLNLSKKSESKQKIEDSNFVNAEMKMVNYTNDQIKDENSSFQYKKSRFANNQVTNESDTSTTTINTTFSLDSIKEVDDNRVDKVYTVGCFDLFHYGHVKLIERMRELGKKVIVGVHDSRSIYKLKNRVPIESTEKRMLNVKSYADEVFCIAGTDPSAFFTCIVNLKENETALYVRGDDMPDFPSRQVVENLMPIKFLPYTSGVSSTALRNEKYSHIASNDVNYLEKIN